MLISDLNNDCLKLVLSLLELEDRLKADLVCREWHDAIKTLWKEKPIVSFKPTDFKNGHMSAAQFNLIFKAIGNRLQLLSLDKLYIKADSWIDSVVENCGSSLTYLSLSNSILSESTIATLLSHLSVEELDLSESVPVRYHYPPKSFSNVMFPRQRHCRLKKFLCNRVTLTDNFFESLTSDSGETITDLNFETCDLQLDCFTQFCCTAATTLTTLHLKMVKCSFGGEQQLNAIGQLTRLTHLTITEDTRRGVDTSVIVTDSLIDSISTGCLQLVYLNIYSSNLTDAGVIHLKKLSRLERLAVAGNRQLHDWSIGELTTLEGLKQLHLCGCTNLQGSFVGRIVGFCQHLELLGLYGCTQVSSNQLLSDRMFDCLAERPEQIRHFRILTGQTQMKVSWLFSQADLNGLKLTFDDSNCPFHYPLMTQQRGS